MARNSNSAPLSGVSSLTPPTAWTRSSPLDQDHSSTSTLVLVLLIAAAALLIRLFQLAQPSLWVDEIYSVQHALRLADGLIRTRFLADVLTLVGLELGGVDAGALDPDRIWEWQAAGVNEWIMRLPFAILGALSILLLGAAAKRMLGARTVILLCLFLALSPWHLWMSQACRFYMQLFLLYNLALIFYYEAIERDQAWRMVVGIACAVLAFYTTPIALMIVAVFGLDIAFNLLRGRATGMRRSFWVIALAGLALCAAAIVWNMLQKQYEGFVGTHQSFGVLTLGMVYLIGAPFVVVAVLGIWSLVSARRERLAVFLTAAAIVPPCSFMVFNLLDFDTHVRYTFVALFGWLALAAIGTEAIIGALEQRIAKVAAWAPAAALLATFATADYVYMTEGEGYRAQWRAASAYVERHRQPGDLIAGEFSAQRAAMFYMREPHVAITPREGFSAADLRALMPSPGWIIISAYRPSLGDRSDGLDFAGDLRAYYVNRGAEPAHTINVYYYDPGEVGGRSAGKSPDAPVAAP